ncbi:MAG TPA: hypothetical protein VFX39_02825, partial [Gemmatimonadaceae bacterium]|nr:hypothetical protein [Gemmatimonadaceae bacterium]
LEEPLQRYDVFAVVHGHAHNGSLEGATARGVPVYNVAMPLMRKRFPERPPFRVIEIPLGLPDRRGAADGAGGEHAAYDEGPPPSPVPPPVETTVGR